VAGLADARRESTSEALQVLCHVRAAWTVRLASCEQLAQLPKDPGIAQRRAAEHHGVAAGLLEHA
jgi:hypothetical protein